MKGNQENKGKLIVGMGLPSCGKSTIFKLLGRKYGLAVFCEPEEKEWASCVNERDLCGHFTALTWFRSDRVVKLFKAHSIKCKGETVLMDSYYDKLVYYYIKKPGMEWLIETKDPYFSIAEKLAKKDWELLPNADVLIFFKIDYNTWKIFLKKRDRNLDKNKKFLNSFSTQKYFLEASRKYCNENKSTIIIFNQKNSTPQEAADELSNLLIKKSVFKKLVLK